MRTKTLFLCFVVPAALLLMGAVVITKTSQYPNLTTPGTNDLFLLARTNGAGTNFNIKYSDLKASINATNVIGSGSANSLAQWTATNKIGSLPNGEGVLVNDGSGAFVWTTNVGAIITTNIFNTIITTNQTIVNNLTVSNITVTNVTVQNNLTVSNLYTVNGKNNTLTVTNNLTIVTNGSLTLSNLPAPSVLVLGTNRNVTNATLSGLTLGNDNTLTATSGTTVSVNATNVTTPNFQDSATVSWAKSGSNLIATAAGGGGASTWLPIATLAYTSATNVTMDASGGTNFLVNVTNTTFMAAPANAPGSSTTTNTCWTVTFKMNATGGYAVTWTNLFKFPGGPTAAFQPTTNANAVSKITICASCVTNGVYEVPDYGVYDIR
jgi:hypothetical protein